jgi:hypothetical protein
METYEVLKYFVSFFILEIIRQFSFQYSYQFPVAKPIVVFYLQNNEFFVDQRRRKTFIKQLLMTPFHHKNNIGPKQQLFIYPDPGLFACTCRTRVMSGMIFKQSFSGRAAPLVFAANEKEIRQL